MQGCNGLSSRWTIRSSYSLESPLDSTTIDPITRSPNYHHETGKIENLSRENLCLAHSPLELDDDILDFLTTFLDCVGLTKTSRLLPHTPLWVSHSSAHLHKSIDTTMDGKIQALHLFIMLHLNLHTTILMTITTRCHPFHGLYDIFLLTQAHGHVPNPT